MLSEIFYKRLVKVQKVQVPRYCTAHASHFAVCFRLVSKGIRARLVHTCHTFLETADLIDTDKIVQQWDPEIIGNNRLKKIRRCFSELDFPAN